jgi:hypothetical protein
MTRQDSVVTCIIVITLSESIGLPAFAESFIAFVEYFLTSMTITSTSARNFSAPTQSCQASREPSVLNPNHVKHRLQLPCLDAINSNGRWVVLESKMVVEWGGMLRLMNKLINELTQILVCQRESTFFGPPLKY